jgi:hypothetical protein
VPGPPGDTLRAMRKSQPKAAGKAASKLISEKIAELGDWRGAALARIRALIREADPGVWKSGSGWGLRGWSHDGGIHGRVVPGDVKLTFFKGTSLKILPSSSTPASTAACGAARIHEGGEIDANAFGAHPRPCSRLLAERRRRNASAGRDGPDASWCHVP